MIVEVCIGITGNTSDFVLPAHVPVGKLVLEIVKLVEQVFPNLTLDAEKPMLCDLERNCIISSEMTLAQAGIRDSSRLLLV